jgi:uncharacterized protein (UPF0548 family)
MALGSIPNIRIFRHDQKSIDKTINVKQETPFNHEYSGLSYNDADPSIPKSFRFLNDTVVIGKGLSDFDKASKFMFDFEAVNSMPWANVVLSSNLKKENVAVGTVLCTLIKCYKSVWTCNPCRVCYIHRSSSDTLKSREINIVKKNGIKHVNQIAYSTVEGHLIAGEERFRVSLMSNDDVVFDIYSFTKGSGLLGTLAMPFIRPIQSAFFKDVTLSMKKLMMDE